MLRDFGPCGIIFMRIFAVIAVTMVMVLGDLGPNGIIFKSRRIY
jgi:hypothetical protein